MIKTKTRLKLIVILAIGMIACLCAGCSIGFPSYDEELASRNISTIVTYYGNGGYFNSSYVVSSDMLYTSGTRFYEIEKKESPSQTGHLITRENYELLGWYEVKQTTLTADGEEKLYFALDVDDGYMSAYKQSDGTYGYTYVSSAETVTIGFINRDGEWLVSREDYDAYVVLRNQYSDDAVTVPPLVCTDRQFTDSDILDGGNLYVAALWTPSIAVNYVLVIKDLDETGQNYVTVSGGDDEEDYTVKEGEILYKQYFGTSGKITVNDANGLPSVSVTDATALKFYTDKDCTESADGMTFERGETDLTLYVEYLCGKWTIVRGVSDLRTLFNTRNGNYYFINDIDCSDTYAFAPMFNFSGRIEGNGFEIKNISINPGENLVNGSTTSIFGTLRNGAEIHDLAIVDMNVSYTVRPNADVYIYLLFGSVNDGCKPVFDNFSIENVELSITISDSSRILNLIQTDEGYDDSGWIYDVSYNDEEWLQGLTVSGYTVNIGPANKLETVITDKDAD